MPRPAESPYRFAVPDLLSEAGRRRDERVVEPVHWALELSRPVEGGRLDAPVTLEGVNGGIFVRGNATVPYNFTCHRCITEWDGDVRVRIAELVGEGADYELDGDVIDLEPVLRDAVLGGLPDSPTCRADCRGLCATCGTDLNTDPCSGHDEEPESPFAVLRDLLEP